MLVHQGQLRSRTYESWKEACDHIESRMAPATDRQLVFAKSDRERLKGLPFLVAATVLQETHAEVLDLPASSPTAARLLALEDVWEQAFPRRKLPEPIDTTAQVSAWIEYAYLSIRKKALSKLKLKKRDIVANVWSDQRFEVRSMGSDGRVYFMGGKGQRSWPDRLILVERYNPKKTKASKIRKSVENDTSNKTRRYEWSSARNEQLLEFSVSRDASLEDALYLAKQALEVARDEHAMQLVFAQNPILLTSLLSGGHGRYQWDRPRLGERYVPDFVLADVDSAGIHYTLVELESPNAPLYLKDGNLAKAARDGINQIQDWRNWLEDNISYARQRRTENGLGFIDIDARPAGLLIVGRQTSLGAHEKRRLQTRGQNNIEIRTYDGILEDLDSRLHIS